MTMPHRISLADMSRINANVLLKGDSSKLNTQESPTLEELTECLCFSPGDGRIWLNDERMLLIHNASLSTLRRELIDTLGLEGARGVLTRTGFESGKRDANLVKSRWPDAEITSIFGAGIQLHALEGIVKVETIYFEFDIETGRYEGEFLWHHSCEDDAHIHAYGVGADPACWLELGYAMGYVSTLVGNMVIFREVECRSMGHAACKVIAKTADLWPDASEDLYYLAKQVCPLPPPHQKHQVTSPKKQTDQADRPVTIGASSAFKAATQAITRVAKTSATVLLTGESGVGKELFASLLHQLSPRENGPFIAFNCAAIPENLLESELFGVERGAYTGASHSRPGRFERAQGGTIFLDEIGTLSLVGQSKLLRVLQEKEIERVGGTRAIKVDVRIVAATNDNLKDKVAKGEFREDLYYRLNVYPIPLPPLRERRDDIPLLVNHYYEHYCQLHGRELQGISIKALQALYNYDFPGNIRELQNLVERGVIAANDHEKIETHHFFRTENLSKQSTFWINQQGELTSKRKKQTSDDSESLLERLKQTNEDEQFSINKLEERLLHEAMDTAQGNMAAAARSLGLTRAQLAYRLKKVVS
ncbi:sigma-54-dependent Fis family transcriptional regulator [Marinomonas spartinae]|uniref:sigma-54-dependent Fis family transcriptional regulator n=1 Tax=Marinomonas spartinae TaxID=1792290 RepID=UPI0018F1415F|nr:sigma-54-dependent Fis family transcriptional regulator [Marinomonas spartinae]MBJ7553546.1 sigma 54-interacting transcriptional regulator [Marinomonas spartinae]